MTNKHSANGRVPAGLKTSGRRLWASVLAKFELDEHELLMLREACRTADLCDELERDLSEHGAVIDGPQGRKASPAAVELRQQRVVLARLLAALRMPQGAEGDQQASARPQRRTGMRGVHGLRGVS